MGTPIVAEILSIILKNKIFAYVLLLSFLIIDSGASILSGGLFYGVLGTAFTIVINYFGFPIVVLSSHILIIAVISPVLFWAVSN